MRTTCLKVWGGIGVPTRSGEAAHVSTHPDDIAGAALESSGAAIRPKMILLMSRFKDRSLWRLMVLGAVRQIQLARFSILGGRRSREWGHRQPAGDGVWATNPGNVIHKSRKRGLHQCTAGPVPNALESA
jgi:hypothetical protein